MKELYAEGLVTHSDPESWGRTRKDPAQALTGALAGPDTEPRKLLSDVDPVPVAGRPNGLARHDECQADPTRSMTQGTSGTFDHENREILQVPGGVARLCRMVKGPTRTTIMNALGKSDEDVVPLSHRRPTGRGMGEGRSETAENPRQSATSGAQDPGSVSIGLERVREAARRDGKMRFTSLLHLVTLVALEEAYAALQRQASPGVDGVTWAAYGEGLATRLADLHGRVQNGTYRCQPSKRAWIPKADGSKRPLGIACLEDKIVQQAVSRILTAIYEEDFANFSYGFRPGRSQHQALDALWVGIREREVNWIVDADIQGFFDSIDHEWLMKFLEHRIGDKRILRLLRKWLRAGVSESGEWSRTTVGTPQGAVISPLLANVFLHYALDQWMTWWRNHEASGAVIFVRYADDFVAGFQSQADAQKFLHDLRERVAKFGLRLHPDKTRLIEFGRFASANRAGRGEGRPETFNFLGFTHRCGTRRSDGGFIVLRQSMAKRMGATLHRIGQHLLLHRSLPMDDQGRWLAAAVRGWFGYHAVPGNTSALRAFRDRAIEAWRRALQRRSQTAKVGLSWEVMRRLADRYLPKPCVLHPYPSQRLIVRI